MRMFLCIPAIIGLASACTEAIPETCKSRGDFDTAVYMGFKFGGSGEELIPLCVDKYPASRLDATASGPGRDESYAASQPGVIPWTQVTVREAALACGRGGKFLCEADAIVGTQPFLDTALNQDPYPYASALRPIEDYEVPDQPDVTVIIGGGPAVPLPEATGSLIYLSGDKQLVGSIIGDLVRSDSKKRPLPVRDFRHPLVGFRCCVDSRLRNVFEPLPKDPSYLLAEEPVVPISGGSN